MPFFMLSNLDSHITIGDIILDVFGDSVAPLINSSLELAVGKYFNLISQKNH